MRIFIVGAGEVGFHIATSLAREGHDLVVIEADAAQAQKVQAELDVMAIHGDGCQPSLLKEHGIEQAELFFSVSRLRRRKLARRADGAEPRRQAMRCPPRESSIW